MDNRKMIYLDDAIEAVSEGCQEWRGIFERCKDGLLALPSAQPDIMQNLSQYKCYITDEDGLQHEVIHTGDIRRVTGWTI